MTRIAVSDVRKDLSNILNKAHYSGKRFMLVKHGKPAAAIISAEDLEILEALEDRLDLEIARRSLAEAKKKGTIPWEKLEEELGLGGKRTKVPS